MGYFATMFLGSLVCNDLIEFGTNQKRVVVT
jgi:hypothetical protein